MLHSGIDLHKRTIVLSTVDAQRTRLAEAELPTSRAAVLAYFAKHPGPHRAVVESTLHPLGGASWRLGTAAVAYRGRHPLRV